MQSSRNLYYFITIIVCNYNQADLPTSPMPSPLLLDDLRFRTMIVQWWMQCYEMNKWRGWMQNGKQVYQFSTHIVITLIEFLISFPFSMYFIFFVLPQIIPYILTQLFSWFVLFRICIENVLLLIDNWKIFSTYI